MLSGHTAGIRLIDPHWSIGRARIKGVSVHLGLSKHWLVDSNELLRYSVAAFWAVISSTSALSPSAISRQQWWL
ncbi:hypothetical protein CEXT_166221 [Caerostris extrusa]|uniref:Uncharacterized protein n=1 Tax=Caerostris extrusa TaxID=172846 RepID=A0AAV4PJP6_CAEEX|nr:hypothetical protein CEXT_166221 [Caerostris extrusa]